MTAPFPGLRPFRKILFCTDFSENADFAFQYAIDAASRRPGCALHLLHVIPEPEAQFWKTYLYEIEDIDIKAKANIDAKIDETYRPRVPADMELVVEVRIGKDYARILEYAEEEDVDLIVMGRHGKSSWGTVLFGNVTEKITRHADCAILVVPLSYEERAREANEKGTE
ncbi:universal stress protein [bacterium]|nr:universal stress protein [bacterium]